MEEIFINLGVSALLVSLKDPKKKEKMRKIFLKVFTAIWAQFSSDESFQMAVGLK